MFGAAKEGGGPRPPPSLLAFAVSGVFGVRKLGRCCLVDKHDSARFGAGWDRENHDIDHIHILVYKCEYLFHFYALEVSFGNTEACTGFPSRIMREPAVISSSISQLN